uniref:Cation/proton exchanger n=1 Tax=Brachypodium sylvaticum TaxID=29664 RepID=C3TX83_BRASY|nr:cation/proton exchanger [Brachypodium sylvaticum]
MTSSVLSANYNTILFEFGVTLVSSKILYALLRKLYQPRVFSDLLLGILLAQFRILSVTNAINLVFAKLGPFVFAPYLFALGVEMDPFALLLDAAAADAVVAYAGILSTAALVAALHSAVVLPVTGIVHERSLRAFLGLAAVLANTASPVLTRLATDLKIAKTNVGRLAVGAGVTSDMVTTLLIALGSMVWRDGDADAVTSSADLAQPLLTGAALLAVAMSGFASRAMAEWVDGRNPEGRRMRGFDLSLVALAAAAMCWVVSALQLDFNMAAFMVGLAFPSEGRVSRLLVSKANFVLSSFVLPLYVAHVCLSLRQTTDDIEAAGVDPDSQVFRVYVMQLPFPWWKVFFATAMGTLGKVAGCAGVGLIKGLGWLEALALGMLLNVKGYFHIYCALAAFEAGIITDKSFMALIFMVALNVAVTPVVGMGIASWARRSVQWRLMGLQHHDPATELRLVVGLHGAQDVPTLAFLVDSLRSCGGGGLACYAVDMVQLTDQTAAAIVKGGGFDGVTVVDEEVSEMRKLIGEALDAYVSGDIKVRRLLALSSFQDMHGDMCICAEDAMAALILLPFHKTQCLDGTMDAAGLHYGFRLVNQKVLQLAPCSVGIMVDRGLGRLQNQQQNQTPVNVVVVFIGGADDREALTLAAFVCKHPGIRLTALRIVQSAAAQARARARTSLFESKSRRNILHLQAAAPNGGAAASNEELQAQADDKFFAEFYRKHVAGNKGAVGYLEKHVADGAELVSVLRGMQGDYRLFVVGKGRDRNSVLTEGLDEWAECLELGPVGDILASSDFSATASVLIVQQYDAKKHYKVIDDEFMPL